LIDGLYGKSNATLSNLSAPLAGRMWKKAGKGLYYNDQRP
jgi:hypothetical protein